MRVVVVRHGHDLPGPAGELELSGRGRESLRRLAGRLAGAGFESFELACSSPTLRAEQSLDELEAVVQISKRSPMDILGSGRPSRELDALILGCCHEGIQSLLLVGHEPQLGNAIVEWCQLTSEDGDRAALGWVIGRGEALGVDVELVEEGVRVDGGIMFFGRSWPMSECHRRPVPGSG